MTTIITGKGESVTNSTFNFFATFSQGISSIYIPLIGLFISTNNFTPIFFNSFLRSVFIFCKVFCCDTVNEDRVVDLRFDLFLDLIFVCFFLQPLIYNIY